MTEAYPDDNELLNLTAETETGVEYIETGKAPYYLEFRKLLHRLLLATRRANDLRVFDEGGLHIGVKAGTFRGVNDWVDYPGSGNNPLADNTENYVSLAADGTLQISTAGFPSADEFHLPLAQVSTANGDITAITDKRGGNMWGALGAAISPLNCSPLGGQGSLPFILQASITGGNTVSLFNGDAPFAFRVLDAWSVTRGAAGGTWKLSDGSTDITDTVTLTAADKTLDRAGNLDDACWDIEKSGTLTVVGDGTSADCLVSIMCMRI